jgi:ABC-2 type transport system permease protein
MENSMSGYAMWISFYTIVRKEMVRLFRIWTQTFLPPAITTGLYFLIFGKFIGSQVAPINGVSYMQFIVPGLVMMSVITQTFMNSAFTFYMAKFQKTLEEVAVSPTPYLIVILGHVASAVIRGILTALIVLGVALFFTKLSMAHLGLTFLFVFLSSLLFALAGLINGVFANSFDTVSIFPTFILTPLTYLGGVFYSISVLPEIWQHISLANPILYMVNGFRYGMLGFSDTSVVISLAILGGLVALLTFINWWIFKTGKGLRA